MGTSGGAQEWGIAGMILFLPFAAMLKVVCEEYEELKPIAILIGSQNYTGESNESTTLKRWIKKVKTWFS
jgi:predicted PurR-regulated permease PerM